MEKVVGVRVTIIGTTNNGFRFVVKCSPDFVLKIHIFEGGHWRPSISSELDFYLENVDEWDAVVHQHQDRRWVTLPVHMTQLSVLRN